MKNLAIFILGLILLLVLINIGQRLGFYSYEDLQTAAAWLWNNVIKSFWDWLWGLVPEATEAA